MKAYKSEFLGLISAIGLLGFLAITPDAMADKPRGPDVDGPRLPGAGLLRERVAERLELDDIQRQQIANILEAAKPEFDALRDRVRTDIEAVLTEEQLAELEDMKSQKRERRGDRR